MITAQHLSKAMTYGEFDHLLQELLQQGKTTGNNQSEEFIEYARINLQRMHRVHKTTQLAPLLVDTLKKLPKPVIFLVITEGWCGDSAQIVPVLDRMAAASTNIELKFLLRDENLELMDQYLTNGARSIPKLVCVEKESLETRFVWGPRPAALQAEVQHLLAAHVSKEEKGLFVQKWYNENKTMAIQEELNTLLSALH